MINVLVRGQHVLSGCIALAGGESLTALYDSLESYVEHMVIIYVKLTHMLTCIQHVLTHINI